MVAAAVLAAIVIVLLVVYGGGGGGGGTGGGVTDLLPSSSGTVWVGLSAGSMVMTPVVGDDFIRWRPPSGDENTLGVVDFSICPHLATDGSPGNSMAEAEEWAASIPNAAYAMDDQTAIVGVAGEVRVVSEGIWARLRTQSSAPGQGQPPPETARR